MVKYQDRFDSLIQYLVDKLFPQCDWRLIKAQVAQESGFKPDAQSPVGAKGLLQLMPGTDIEIDGDIDGFEIEGNLENGICYLRTQYSHFPEIPDHNEKLKFALASYNGGRGYVNRALKLAYEFEHGVPMPRGHKEVLPGKWQRWEFTKEKLKASDCIVRGRRPDHKQMIDYVARIWAGYQRLLIGG